MNKPLQSSARPVKSERAIIRFGVASGRASGQVSLCKVKGVLPECVLELTGLYIDPSARGRGWAHMLMEMSCKYADERGTDLVLRICPFGNRRKKGADKHALYDLYKKYGFARFQSNAWDMVRSKGDHQ